MFYRSNIIEPFVEEIPMHVVRSFMEFAKRQETREYVESMFLFYAAPVIMRLRCGSLFAIRRDGDNIAAAWKEVGTSLLERHDVRAIELPSKRGGWNSVLLLAYDPPTLRDALSSDAAVGILCERRYGNCADVDGCLRCLKERFGGEFPHEIGLFLGYPPGDVRGFLRDNGKGAVATGYWKVYSNVREAKTKFRKFRSAERSVAREILRRSAARAS
jgi:hypothetical protein